MKILITGASGFLGSKLAIEFHEMGHDVSLLLRQTSRLGRLPNCEAKFITGRATNKNDIKKFVSKIVPDIVIHTACSYGRGGEVISDQIDANYRFGVLILEGLLEMGRAVNFINTGTSLDPAVNLYALTKNQFKELGHFFANVPESKLRFINVVLEHMYGPGDQTSKFTSHVIETFRRNLPKLDLTIGTQKRDFIYIDDVVSAYVCIVENINQFKSSEEVEVGSGVAPTLKEFVKTAYFLSGASTRLNFGAIPLRPREAMHCQANISKMQSLGWMPKYDIESGIRKILELGE